jgi:hypothetical protein
LEGLNNFEARQVAWKALKVEKKSHAALIICNMKGNAPLFLMQQKSGLCMAQSTARRADIILLIQLDQ